MNIGYTLMAILLLIGLIALTYHFMCFYVYAREVVQPLMDAEKSLNRVSTNLSLWEADVFDTPKVRQKNDKYENPHEVKWGDDH